MTIEEVQARLASIRERRYDDERAHGEEDDLFAAVLKHHAALGCPLATEALKSLEIDFARWCA